MKRLIYILISMIPFFTSCEKGEDFNYQMSNLNEQDVDSISLTANHDMMLNEKGNLLSLKLYLYKKIVKEDKTHYYTLLESRAPQKAIAYCYVGEDGQEKEISSPLIAGDMLNAGNYKVYAKVFGKKSNELPLLVRKPESLNFPERNIDIIFHVVEFGGLPVTEYRITAEFIKKKLDKANIAFRKISSTAPNAVDCKLNFIPVVNDEKGNLMEHPGCNFTFIPKEKIEDLDPTSKTVDYNSFIKKNRLFWGKGKVLNVWIVRTKKSVPTSAPGYIDQDLPELKGLKLKIADNSVELNPTDCGIVIEYNSFIKENLAMFLGKYLGLLPTSYSKNKVPAVDTDYCDDTFMYSSNDQSFEYKNDPKRNIGFTSDNIMDTKSTGTTVSLDQAKRINLILEHSPARKIWK